MIEHSQENIDKLADRIVDGMDMDSVMNIAFEYVRDNLGNYKTFVESCKEYELVSQQDLDDEWVKL